MEKQCSKCHAAFTCQNEQRGCWCESLVLSDVVLALLRERYGNCLCPSCLKEFEALSAASITEASS